MRLPSTDTILSDSRGSILLEVMLSLTLFALVVVPMFAVEHNTISTAGKVRIQREAMLLARTKMEELLTGIEENTSGIFLNEDNEEIAGYRWEVEIKMLQFYPDPEDEPTEEEKQTQLPSAEEDASLIKMIEMALHVYYPADDDKVASGKNRISLSTLRFPTDEEVDSLEPENATGGGSR